MPDDHGDLFNEEGMPSEMEIAYEAMAPVFAAMFKALKRQHISAQEAAAITAAFFAQTLPVELQGPQDGS